MSEQAMYLIEVQNPHSGKTANYFTSSEAEADMLRLAFDHLSKNANLPKLMVIVTKEQLDLEIDQLEEDTDED